MTHVEKKEKEQLRPEFDICKMEPWRSYLSRQEKDLNSSGNDKKAGKDDGVNVVNPCFGYINDHLTKMSDEQAALLLPMYLEEVVVELNKGNELVHAHADACWSSCYKTFRESPKETEFWELSTDTARRYELFHMAMLKMWIHIVREIEKKVGERQKPVGKKEKLSESLRVKPLVYYLHN